MAENTTFSRERHMSFALLGGLRLSAELRCWSGGVLHLPRRWLLRELVYGFRYTSNHRIQSDVLVQRQAQKSPQGLRCAGSQDFIG